MGFGLADDKSASAPASACLDNSPLAQCAQSITKGRTAHPEHFRQCCFRGQAFAHFEQPEGNGRGKSLDYRVGPFDFG